MSEKISHEFQTDVQQILELVTHSLYSHKDIFLRELISNASDAIDKVRFESLTNKELLENNSDWKIHITADKDKKTLILSDNGCGMNQEDLINHLGTIAKSGTQEFLDKIKKSKENVDLIGQFGVGFYSSFMVADKVIVQTKKAGESGWQWTSAGKGSFEIESFEKESRGTDIIIHLKSDSEEFLEEWTIKQVVKKYSDFVEFPITMNVEKSEYPKDKDGNPDYNAKAEVSIEEETLNSQKAIWLKSKSEISKEEYKNFYQHISHDFQDPFETIHFSAEGALEFKALMYIPSKAPQNLYTPEAVKGLHLYINRVFIMDECKKLLPEYLRFISGVVDSSDLPLNVSREILQDNPQLEKIKKNLVQKVLSTLKKLKDKDEERYQAFFQEFGPVMKEGLHYDQANKDKIIDLLLFETNKTESGKRISLKEYVEKMPDDQKEIYYIVAENRTKALSSPQLEQFESKGFQVLLLTDQVDHWITPSLNEYEKKSFKSITGEDVKIDDDEKSKSELEEKTKTHEGLIKAVQTQLDEEIKEVKFSSKLVQSACCLSTDAGGVTPQMEQMFKAMGQEVPKQKYILELNPKHELIQVLDKLHQDKKEEDFKEYVNLIFEQASITYGNELKNPIEFAKKISELMVKAA